MYPRKDSRLLLLRVVGLTRLASFALVVLRSGSAIFINLFSVCERAGVRERAGFWYVSSPRGYATNIVYRYLTATVDDNHQQR